MAFDDIQLELGVATQCGKCESCARAVWAECSPGLNTAHIFQTSAAEAGSPLAAA